MLAILLALASAAGYGGSDYAGGLAARRGNVIRITILAQAVAAALMIFILPLAGLPAPSPGGLAWGAAAGVGEAIGALALYAGFRDAAFSVAGPISAVGSAGFSVLAGLLLGERRNVGDDRNRTRAAGHHRRVGEPRKRAARARPTRPRHARAPRATPR
jgi:drug/metabolite transporter (DMT)-like permease